MKSLTWKLILPLTIISFFIFTKWWFVLPVDAPDSMMAGFPLPYVCDGWHTSMSLQVFIMEFLINFGLYFLFWFGCVYACNRFFKPIKLHKGVSFSLIGFSGFIIIVSAYIINISSTHFKIKRDFDVEVLESGYKFIWQNQKRPIYDPEKYSK